MAGRVNHDPLSDEAMAHLKSYKYSSVDKSLISNYLLKHYWNGAVKLLPMSLAPNMVTLLGYFCILINIILLEIYVPDLIGPAPSWVYYSFALGLWMYSTMDNIDGKQARRTGTSSGLGELFDHGIDSLNCTMASLCETAAMGVGASKTGAFVAMVPCLPMFFSTWETYHTHTLYLGAFNGPTEGLMIACLGMVISGYYGPHIWHVPLADLFGYPELIGNISLCDIWVPVILIAFFTAHLPACVYHVVQARQRQNLPIAPVFLEWMPMIIFSGSCAAWFASPYSILLKDNHLVLFCVIMSFVFGRLTTKIILHHLTRRPFPYWTVALLPLTGGAFLAWLPIFGLKPVDPTFELYYLYGYLIFAVGQYFVWAIRVINRICAELDINCLTIKKRNANPVEAATSSKAKANEVANERVNGSANGAVRRTRKEL